MTEEAVERSLRLPGKASDILSGCSSLVAPTALAICFPHALSDEFTTAQ